MRVIILLAFLGTAIAVPKSVNRIMGGSVTTVENYPYMANMQYNWLGWWFLPCGGSLLTANAVLSAAHCYYDHPTDWRVVLGSSFATSGGTVFGVAAARVHQGFNLETLEHDIAIVILANPAQFSNSVQPARIPGPNYVLADGATVTAIGWGTLSYGGLPAEQLKHVDINIINQQLCADRYAYLKTLPGFDYLPDVTDGMICAGILDVGGKGACHDDGGGPLAHHGDVIVGITSWSHRCGEKFYPGVSTRVNQYTDWILANSS